MFSKVLTTVRSSVILAPRIYHGVLKSDLQRLTCSSQPNGSVKHLKCFFAPYSQGKDLPGVEGTNIVQMRGLDPETTEQDVMGYFAPLSLKPKKVNILRDIAGRASGSCEVEFATSAEAVVAMRKKNAFMGNRFIRLSLKASSDSFRDFSLFQNKNLFGKTDTSLNEKHGVLAINEHAIRMRNLPPRVTDQAIYEFFQYLNVRPTSIRIVYDETGCRTGEVDVLFMSREDAVKAMCKNNSRLGRHSVELELKCETPDSKDNRNVEVTNAM